MGCFEILDFHKMRGLRCTLYIVEALLQKPPYMGPPKIAKPILDWLEPNPLQLLEPSTPDGV